MLDEKRHKLEDKTVRGNFLGYNTKSKGYRVYNLQTKKLTISRDVEVDENVAWNWEEEKIKKKPIYMPINQPIMSSHEDNNQNNDTLETSTTASYQDEFSPETTPRRVRSLMDIYETCNMALL